MNQVITTIKDSNFTNSKKFSNLVDLLRHRALFQQNQTAFTYLEDEEGLESTLTYQQLDTKARAIAIYLHNMSISGERVLLLYPPGLDYIAAFFGCLYAELIAIPLYSPRNNRNMSRILAIMEDSQAQIALTNNKCLTNVQTLFDQAPDLKKLQCLATDQIDEGLADRWVSKSVSSVSIAYLQYTSGSTSIPKGVMISHNNALENSAEITTSWKTGADSVLVSWLPHFHDFGQIYGVIQPIYNGFPCVFMSPASFIQKPARWLKAISDYKATHSGAPNFAYDLCAEKINSEQRKNLDLSSWEVAVNGAEPVRKRTLENFNQAFAPCGFRSSTFYPGYGLAEATLQVSSTKKKDLPTILTVGADSLAKNLIIEVSEDEPFAKTLVGCGSTALNTKIVIVDTESLTESPSGRVGEIWVSGPSVAQGYWGRVEETQHTFGAYLADNPKEPFLRTGDLGFLKDDELYITGRIKDLIVIRGSNHYPQDIELTVEESHPSVRSGYSAVFAIDENDREKLVVVCEIERTYLRKLDADQVIRAICEAVSKEHELDVSAVLLLKTGGIPKTSSGKIQRHACRTQFLNNQLDAVEKWKDKSNEQAINEDDFIMHNNLSSIVKFGVQDWLISWIAKNKNLDIKVVDPNQSFNYYGLSSLDSMNLHVDLETWLGYSIFPDWLWDAPSIDALASQISQHQNTFSTVHASS